MQEKPKEKTIFNVRLESFEATAKPKIIKEVKSMNPTLTLMAVCTRFTLGDTGGFLMPFNRLRISWSHYQKY